MSSGDWKQDKSLYQMALEKVTPEIQGKMVSHVSEEVKIVIPENDENKVQNEDTDIRVLQPSDSYNGAVRDTYAWSQTITDIDVLVKLPKLSLRTQDLQVNIETQRIKINANMIANEQAAKELQICGANSKEPKWITIFEGKLTFKTKKNESVWSLVPGYVSIHLEKASERWWDALITEEPRLDLNKIDCSRNLDEMGSTEQMKIEELMWNHQQKLLGKPMSDQLKLGEIMKKAWNAEGSPFQGTPYDPSIIKFN